MVYGTSFLAERWEVSGETVRRYLKKFGKKTNSDGLFVVDDEAELAEVEKFISGISGKYGFRSEDIFGSSGWKVKKISKKPFKVESLEIEGLGICFGLLDDKDVSWNGFFFCKTKERALYFLRKLRNVKSIIVNGIENKEYHRLVLSKIKILRKNKKRM